MPERRTVEKWLFRAGYVALVLFMLAPLIVVIGTSFSHGGHLQFPPEELSVRWYGEYFQNSSWINATQNSIFIAIGAMVVSLVLGTSAAFGYEGLQSKWSRGLIPLILLPLLIPAAVIAITLYMFLSQMGLQHTYIGIILAHSLWATPLVFFIMQAVFTRFDWELKDAAMDLGATPMATFREVILPGVRYGVIASAIVAFVISFQEFIMALFLAGIDERTVPVLAFLSLKEAINPLISVVSTLMIIIVVMLLVPASLAMGLERLAKQL